MTMTMAKKMGKRPEVELLRELVNGLKCLQNNGWKWKAKRKSRKGE